MIAVRLENGETIAADAVIVGIGIMPDIEPLLRSGIVCTNGIDVDEFCRTSADNIFAIGDLALHHNKYAHGDAIRTHPIVTALNVSF